MTRHYLAFLERVFRATRALVAATRRRYVSALSSEDRVSLSSYEGTLLHALMFMQDHTKNFGISLESVGMADYDPLKDDPDPTVQPVAPTPPPAGAASELADSAWTEPLAKRLEWCVQIMAEFFYYRISMMRARESREGIAETQSVDALLEILQLMRSNAEKLDLDAELLGIRP